VPPSDDPPSVGAPTLVCGFPKSGTTLVTSLLDGHPDLLCFPEETWALRTATRLPSEQWMDHILASRAVRRLADGRTGNDVGSRDYSGFAFEEFESRARALWSASPRTPRALLECVLESFRIALGRDRPLRWVEKSPEQEIQLSRHATDWEGLRVVFVVRDPRAVLCSFRHKRARSEQDVFVDGLLTRWKACLGAVIAHESSHPGSVCIVRYEDVVRRPRDVLAHVLSALAVPWHDSVTTPTLLGRPWGGNSMYQAELEGISHASLERWREEIDGAERAVLERCAAAELDAFGYERDRSGPFVRSAWSVVSRQRRGLLARGRALRRLMRLRDVPATGLRSAAFRRAVYRA
jgi:hypothetical protein